MAACNLCSALNKLVEGTAEEKIFDSEDSKKVHARVHASQTRRMLEESGEDGAWLEEEIFQKCFLEETLPVVKEEKKIIDRKLQNEKRQRARCLNLIDEFGTKRGDVRCLLCTHDVRVLVRGDSVVQPRRLVSHVYVHLKKNPYHCAKCSFTTPSRPYLMKHLHQRHRIYTSMESNVNDRSVDLHEEIMQGLLECFDEDYC